MSPTRASAIAKYNSPTSTISYHFYFNRLTYLQNVLSQLDLSSPLSLSKGNLRLFWSHFLNCFNPDNRCTDHSVCPCSKCSTIPSHTNFSCNIVSPHRWPVQVIGWPSVQFHSSTTTCPYITLKLCTVKY